MRTSLPESAIENAVAFVAPSVRDVGVPSFQTLATYFVPLDS